MENKGQRIGDGGKYKVEMTCYFLKGIQETSGPEPASGGHRQRNFRCRRSRHVRTCKTNRLHISADNDREDQQGQKSKEHLHCKCDVFHCCRLFRLLDLHKVNINLTIVKFERVGTNAKWPYNRLLDN